jgi:hypothetical protein
VQFPLLGMPHPVWYVPAGHDVHCVTDVLLVVSRYVPGGHLSHAAVRAVAFEYVPASQLRQSDEILLLHVWHPWIVLYVPRAHSRQPPESGPQYPALHVQFMGSHDPSGELVFCGHEFFIPSAQWCVGGQIVQFWVPIP